ncbi:hypothetical protein TNCV_956861 [Trichonephila clavipes]|nr:hypothetical protein TNCV_956861 [Trichonephila clavipes]
MTTTNDERNHLPINKQTFKYYALTPRACQPFENRIWGRCSSGCRRLLKIPHLDQAFVRRVPNKTEIAASRQPPLTALP